jgi:nucleotide-binding universal stress UspA family protein
MVAIRNVAVPTDFSEISAAALRYGETMAERFDATLHLVHVVENIGMRSITADGFLAVIPELQREAEADARRKLDAAIDRLRARGLRLEGRVITSSATAHAIVTYAQDAGIDLIVIGTHGHGGMSRLLLGSVAERVVRTARCPVLTVHHPERDLPRADAPAAGASADLKASAEDR